MKLASALEALQIGVGRQLVTMMIRARWVGRVTRNLRTENHSVAVDGGRIGVRVYTPAGTGPFATLLFFHGGGWVIGNLATHDPLCRDLCAATQHIVIAVDYRLAPEHPFPSAPQDCIAALQWLLDNGERLNCKQDGIVLCGDSAGGNLAAVVAIVARERWPQKISGQILIYPVTDHYSAATGSYREFAKAQSLTRKSLIWLWDTYLGSASAHWAEATTRQLTMPLRVENLRGLPPAMLLLAEFDPLRDEGLAYAARLRQAGVAVHCKVYSGKKHAFVGAGPTTGHHEAIADIHDWLGKNQSTV